MITAQTIKRLCQELNPPLISFKDPYKDYTPEELVVLNAKDASIQGRYIEGSCYDLELESISKKADPYGIPFLGATKRNIPKAIELPICKLKDVPPDTWRLWNHGSYLLQSAETVSLPPWLGGIVHMRTSEFRSGADVACTFIKPGYSGRITVGLTFLLGAIDIQKGFLFASVAFYSFVSDEIVRAYQFTGQVNEVTEQVQPYKGIWKGAKLTTDGKDERGF